MRAILASLGLGLILTACTSDRTLHDLETTGGGPDEFSVLPVLPLEIPDNLDALPTPTPGGVNRTDRYPVGEGIAALGGDPAATVATGAGVPASDAALVGAAARHGVVADIRQVLLVEDAAFRRARGPLAGGLFGGGDPYYTAYAPQRLDAQAEMIRMRNAGIPVPTAPPPAE
ncbi:hypothetical protein OG2516_10271 [Oceanicola granulosus HTCC2516]|uniref:DUF3035 domain-containing protein n=1 Tax=Oceanicola granulosus (strain ATCC BAA-861 / DSM 15982 / KCTC 12143 / HTCC2516) TaxID=314256 RepID=Q2CKE9_OCEGH|nr:DUF3035 domain-containing protein [Oceanicola granulosus]EAR52840.1 hypothetical protein OG2516_10271 [Oceanicola granulosus HTCC2516]